MPKHYTILDGEEYTNKSVSQLEEEIETIATIKASTEKETLELKIKAIKKLPALVSDNGIRYKNMLAGIN